MEELLSMLALALTVAVFLYAVMPHKKPQSLIKKILIYLVNAAVWFYTFYPAINIHCSSFYTFLMMLATLGVFLFVPGKGEVYSFLKTKRTMTLKGVNQVKILLRIYGAVLLAFVLSGLIFSPLFMAGRYAKRIEVTPVQFEEIPPYNFNETAIIDRNSAQLLGDKVMGEIPELVSQFNVSPEYSQVSYQNGTYRVTPLAYDGFIKYLKNRSEGIPGYITVNTTTGTASLKRTDEKMHYVPSAYFNENLYRRLRFQWPTVLFGSPSFEIDEEGNPWYVCTTYTYTGLSSMKRVTGVILFDPISGNSEKYDIDNAPTWVDRIYPESLVNEELNDYGKYRKGFFNSWITQEGVTQTSEGYNYISKNGDIWLYTGMTSAASDESNVGFMLVNLRTHEAQYTATASASEYAVMASAEGEVLNYGYTATFPVLINVNNKPVYLLSLKDSAGLIKMYAMVDAQDYQQVYTVKTDRDSQKTIANLIKQVSGTTASIQDASEDTITVDEITTAVIDGSTMIYIKSNNKIYSLTVDKDNAPTALFLKEGDKIKITWSQTDTGNEIHSIE